MLPQTKLSWTSLAMILASCCCVDATELTDDEIARQREHLHSVAVAGGFGPQSPRDIDKITGNNTHSFAKAPHATRMNLCNIHLHKNAEHKGGEFTTYAGHGLGFKYDGNFTAAELKPLPEKETPKDLRPGDTLEVHFVYSTANAVPGPTLAACFTDSVNNPQLRVEAQVIALVNDPTAVDFATMAHFENVDGHYQAVNLGFEKGNAVEYTGSTTGPSFNEQGSPFQVTWNVRKNVVKVSIASMSQWLANNPFNEDHAHGVRNLIDDPELLSRID